MKKGLLGLTGAERSGSWSTLGPNSACAEMFSRVKVRPLHLVAPNFSPRRSTGASQAGTEKMRRVSIVAGIARRILVPSSERNSAVKRFVSRHSETLWKVPSNQCK